MDWHCGLLDEPTSDASARNPIRHANWHSLPAEAEHELRVWLAMPGFSLNYHVHTLERDAREIRRFMGGYQELEEDVLVNWVTASREDCMKLGWIRPKKGDLPLITKFQIRRDFLRGHHIQKELAEEYGVWPATVNKLAWGLPDEIEDLPLRLQEILGNDPFVSGMSVSHAWRLKAIADAARKPAPEEKCTLPTELKETMAAGLRRLVEQAKEEDTREKEATDELNAEIARILRRVPPLEEDREEPTALSEDVLKSILEINKV